jgi:N-acetylglutamate synthase-like GNAT family acetyltransferase
MITVSKTENKDLKALSAFLHQYKMDESLFMDRLKETMIIRDGDEVLGFGAFVLKEQIGIIDLALIGNEMLWPSLGDGLVKAMLNTLDLRGASKAYMLTDTAHCKHVEKIGLKRSDEGAESILEKMDAPWILKSQNFVYETALPDFFDHACHSKK